MMLYFLAMNTKLIVETLFVFQVNAHNSRENCDQEMQALDWLLTGKAVSDFLFWKLTINIWLIIQGIWLPERQD